MPRQISLKTIQARIAELQKKAEALEAKVKPGVDKVVALIKKHKLSLDDVKHAFPAIVAALQRLLKMPKKPIAKAR